MHTLNQVLYASCSRFYGKQIGRLTDERWVDFEFIKIIYRLNYLEFCFVYCHGYVTSVLKLHFSWRLSRKAYYKVCFESVKVSVAILHGNPYH